MPPKQVARWEGRVARQLEKIVALQRARSPLQQQQQGTPQTAAPAAQPSSDTPSSGAPSSSVGTSTLLKSSSGEALPTASAPIIPLMLCALTVLVTM